VGLLRLIVDLVEASCYADNPEWRLVFVLNYLHEKCIRNEIDMLC
jgi:hypothetical protein